MHQNQLLSKKGPSLPDSSLPSRKKAPRTQTWILNQFNNEFLNLGQQPTEKIFGQIMIEKGFG